MSKHFTAQVSKRGKSLAICIPSEIVEGLDLNVGDRIEVRAVAKHRMNRDERDRAIAQLKELRGRTHER